MEVCILAIGTISYVGLVVFKFQNWIRIEYFLI